MNYLTDILWIAGAAAITAGVTLLSIAAGFIVAGVALIGFAVLIAWTRGTRKDKANAA